MARSVTAHNLGTSKLMSLEFLKSEQVRCRKIFFRLI